MQQKVAEFMANLLGTGIDRAKVAEMGYSYALALQTDEWPTDNTYVSSLLMFKASELARDAMPEADKINHERCMVKPVESNPSFGVGVIEDAIQGLRGEEE